MGYPPAMDEKTLTMTVEQAACRLGIGRSLAYELARRGELPGVLRLGNRIVVSKAAIERALAGEAQPVAA